MGRLIDFNGNKNSKQKVEFKGIDLVSLLPRLSLLKNETIVFYIDKSVVENEDLLNGLIREIVVLRCMESSIIIVPDINSQIISYCNDNFGISNSLMMNNSIDLCGQGDVFDVIAKSEVINKITNIIRQYNAKTLAISGNNLDFIFPDEVANENVSDFARKNRELYDGYTRVKHEKKYSVDLLNELLKTNIIPVITPTFRDKIGRNFVMESASFGSYISRYLSSLKYILAYTNNNEIPSSCIYGVEKFTRIIDGNECSFETKKIIEAGIDAVRNGVQSVHMINTKEVNLLEELCMSNFRGLFLYDDSLNQL